MEGGSSASDFDYCGAWLNSAYTESDGTIRGWYHAEYMCDYSNGGQTYKSVAYVQSTDGGRTFQKVNYPNNQILTYNGGSITGQNAGEGDHSVVVRNFVEISLKFSREWEIIIIVGILLLLIVLEYLWLDLLYLTMELLVLGTSITMDGQLLLTVTFDFH